MNEPPLQLRAPSASGRPAWHDAPAPAGSLAFLVEQLAKQHELPFAVDELPTGMAYRARWAIIRYGEQPALALLRLDHANEDWETVACADPGSIAEVERLIDRTRALLTAGNPDAASQPKLRAGLAGWLSASD